jgi:hypothetical protein
MIWRVTYADIEDSQAALTRNCGIKMAADLFCPMVHRERLWRAINLPKSASIRQLITAQA